MQLLKCPMPASGIDLGTLNNELGAAGHPYSTGVTDRSLKGDGQLDRTSAGALKHEARYVFVKVPDGVNITTSVRNSILTIVAAHTP